MELKQFENELYYSAPTKSGSMCRPGEITSVFVYLNDFNDQSTETCRIYCTDGWNIRLIEVKRFPKSEFEKQAKKYLNTEY